MILQKTRKELDKIDNQIVRLISKRMNLVKKLAKYKKKNKIKIYHPEREKEIIKEKTKLAKKLKLSPKFIEDLFKNIIKESKRIQKK